MLRYSWTSRTYRRAFDPLLPHYDEKPPSSATPQAQSLANHSPVLPLYPGSTNSWALGPPEIQTRPSGPKFGARVLDAVPFTCQLLIFLTTHLDDQLRRPSCRRTTDHGPDLVGQTTYIRAIRHWRSLNGSLLRLHFAQAARPRHCCSLRPSPSLPSPFLPPQKLKR